MAQAPHDHDHARALRHADAARGAGRGDELPRARRVLVEELRVARDADVAVLHHHGEVVAGRGVAVVAGDLEELAGLGRLLRRARSEEVAAEDVAARGVTAVAGLLEVGQGRRVVLALEGEDAEVVARGRVPPFTARGERLERSSTEPT